MPERNLPPNTRPVPGRPLRAGQDGTIWVYHAGHRRWQALTPKRKRGMFIVQYTADSRRVSAAIGRMVLSAWGQPRPLGMQVVHFPDSDPANNRLENLRWGPKNAHLIGRRLKAPSARRGSNHPSAKLTEQDIPAIRNLYREGFSATEIADRYSVGQMAILRILRGQRWSHVPDPLGPIILRPAKIQEPWQSANAVLDWPEVRKIRRLATKRPRPTNAKLAHMFGVSQQTISLIINHHVWKESP